MSLQKKIVQRQEDTMSLQKEDRSKRGRNNVIVPRQENKMLLQVKHSKRERHNVITSKAFKERKTQCYYK